MPLELKLNGKLNIEGLRFLLMQDEKKLPTIYRVLRGILFKQPPIQSNCGDNGLVLLEMTYPHEECAYYGWQLFRIPEGTAMIEIFTIRSWYDRRVCNPAREPEVERDINAIDITFHQEGPSSRRAEEIVERFEFLYQRKWQLALKQSEVLSHPSPIS